MDGILVIDKPAGMTSHDVVDAVRKRFGTRKVGHAGTLDPDATGVLVIGLGKATRLLEYAQGHPKTYVGTARFGTTTTSQDSSGEVVEKRPAAQLSPEDIMVVLPRFTGELEQIPPMVSAVKVGGERLYQKARRGEEIERAPRAVAILRLEMTGFVAGDEPEASFLVECTSGTYIRTLFHDIGAAVGTGAHMIHLRRTKAAGIPVDEAVALDEVSEQHLRPIADAVRFLPTAEADDVADALVKDGRPIHIDALDGVPGVGGMVAITHGSELRAIYRRTGDTLVAVKVMPR